MGDERSEGRGGRTDRGCGGAAGAGTAETGGTPRPFPVPNKGTAQADRAEVGWATDLRPMPLCGGEGKEGGRKLRRRAPSKGGRGGRAQADARGATPHVHSLLEYREGRPGGPMR